MIDQLDFLRSSFQSIVTESTYKFNFLRKCPKLKILTRIQTIRVFVLADELFTPNRNRKNSMLRRNGFPSIWSVKMSEAWAPKQKKASWSLELFWNYKIEAEFVDQINKPECGSSSLILQAWTENFSHLNALEELYK